ncbi:MAG TPA: VWA domain-containing protein [Acidimicrobiales bacterium]
MATFTSAVFQNEFLTEGADQVQAVVEVTCADAGKAGDQGAVGEIIIVDSSGSMEGDRIAAARLAAVAALEEIPDGTWFAVITGTNEARLAYGNPEGGWAQAMVQMTAATREAAITAVRGLWAGGGTAIGQWLNAAAYIFVNSPVVQRHALLLTDGKNGEADSVLAKGVNAATGVFQCDCRGVGADWNVPELRRIAETLLGSVELISDPKDMAEDFRSVMRAAASRGVPDASLRVWVPVGGDVVFVRQVSPTVEDLTARGVAVDQVNHDYPTGAWGDETREYHVGVRVPVQPLGTTRAVARAKVVVAGTPVSDAVITATWSDDATLTTRIAPEIAHYTGQTALAAAIQEGLAARAAGDDASATVKLGEAVRLAAETGNDDATNRLRKVVDIEESGTVRLKKKVDELDAMDLDTSSTKTTRVKK